jgi:hypothetical protein
MTQAEAALVDASKTKLRIKTTARPASHGVLVQVDLRSIWHHSEPWTRCLSGAPAQISRKFFFHRACSLQAYSPPLHLTPLSAYSRMLFPLVRETRIPSVRFTARNVGQAMVEGLYARSSGVRSPAEAVEALKLEECKAL